MINLLKLKNSLLNLTLALNKYFINNDENLDEIYEILQINDYFKTTVLDNFESEFQQKLLQKILLFNHEIFFNYFFPNYQSFYFISTENKPNTEIILLLIKNNIKIKTSEIHDKLYENTINVLFQWKEFDIIKNLIMTNNYLDMINLDIINIYSIYNDNYELFQFIFSNTKNKTIQTKILNFLIIRKDLDLIQECIEKNFKFNHQTSLNAISTQNINIIKILYDNGMKFTSDSFNNIDKDDSFDEELEQWFNENNIPFENIMYDKYPICKKCAKGSWGDIPCRCPSYSYSDQYWHEDNWRQRAADRKDEDRRWCD
jgi:hypothetical protein